MTFIPQDRGRMAVAVVIMMMMIMMIIDEGIALVLVTMTDVLDLIQDHLDLTTRDRLGLVQHRARVHPDPQGHMTGMVDMTDTAVTTD